MLIQQERYKLVSYSCFSFGCQPELPTRSISFYWPRTPIEHLMTWEGDSPVNYVKHCDFKLDKFSQWVSLLWNNNLPFQCLESWEFWGVRFWLDSLHIICICAVWVFVTHGSLDSGSTSTTILAECSTSSNRTASSAAFLAISSAIRAASRRPCCSLWEGQGGAQKISSLKNLSKREEKLAKSQI